MDPEDENLAVWRACTDTGWMNSVAMIQFLEKFVEFVKGKGLLNQPNDRVILFLDGHASHITYSVTRFCKSSNVILFLLPPNSTHMLQPCDCSAMASLKSLWAQQLVDFRNEYGYASAVSKKLFPRLVRKIFDELEANSQLLRKSFAVTGLYPFDSRAPDFNLLLSEKRKQALWLGNFFSH